ncbi:hypothetical protein Emed_004096 [Eimeria media]
MAHPRPSPQGGANGAFFPGPQMAANAEDGGVIYVPMINQTIRRNRIVEVPEVHVIEKFVPKVTFQDVIKKVPKTEIQWIEKIVEVPQIKVVDKIVEVPQIHEVQRFVPRIEIQEVIKHVPKYHVQKIEKFVEVPQIQVVEKFVEVPQIHEVIKYQVRHKEGGPPSGGPLVLQREKIEYVDVPVERIREVPKVEVKIVEKIRHVPGPIEYIDVPQETVTERPVIEVVEKIIEEPEIQEFVVETPVMVPSQSPPIEIPVEVPVYYDVPQYYPVKGRVIPVEKERIYEKIVEVPVPVVHESVRVVKVPQEVPVDVYKEVPVPQFVDQYVDVPYQVPVYKKPPIIQPVLHNQIIDEPPIYERAPPRYIYEKPIWGAPIYEQQGPPVPPPQNFEAHKGAGGPGPPSLPLASQGYGQEGPPPPLPGS